MRLNIVIAAFLSALWLSCAAWAQTDTSDGFDRWNEFAVTVQNAVDAGTSTDEVFGAFRKRVSEFRSDFEKMRNANAGRIGILRDQIAALGPPPEGEGAVAEPADVTARRADLNSQLAVLLAPVHRGEAEFLRADALIGQIDEVLRERDTSRLLTIGVSPLNPTTWRGALEDLASATRQIWRENSDVRDGRSTRDWAAKLPIALSLALLGVLLILRGRTWSLKIVGSLREHGARGFGIWRFVVSLLRIVLPFVGVCMLVLSIVTTDLFGPKGNAILTTFAVLCGIMLGYRWIADRVFSKDEDEALIQLDASERRAVRFNVGLITFVLVLGVLIAAVLNTGSPSASSEAVLTFPILLLAAFPLFRIGRILRGYTDIEDGEKGSIETRGSTLRRMVRWLGAGAMLVSLVAPLLAVAGYYEAAKGLFTPYVLTLVLLGLVMALQRFSADVYGAFTGEGDQARDALMPVLFGMVFLVLISPVIALAWGARITDLTELWTAIGRGFSVGDTRISPSIFLTFAIIFAIGYMLTRLLQSSLRTNVLPKTRMDIGGQNAVVSGLGYVGIFLAALAAITGAGIDLSSLAIVAGALSVGIGFGLQNIVSNFVSGIILLIERPISEGDWIEVGGQMGYVRNISVRSTRIETFDRTDVIVPNADLVTGTVTNYTRGNTVGRIIVPVGVAYGTDTKRVEGLLRTIAEAQPMVLAAPPPQVFFVNFGADALEFEVRCFLRDVNWTMVVKNDINHAIAAKFAEEGIEIPFAQRDLWLRNPETIAPPPKATE
ncbi:MAG: DUF3772 domain-containing protein [Sulfitobacter sp.]